MPSFVHLHTHSHFSLLEALPTIPELVSHAKKLGFPALALTDYGNLYGALEFYQKARAEGIKPIIGIEIFLAEDMNLKRGRVDKHTSPLVLLAETNEGYRNLLKIATAGHLEGFYYHPRIDLSFLSQHAAGLVALSGSLKGAIPQTIINKDLEKTRELINAYVSIFGKNNFFLELQHHPDLPWQDSVNQELIALGRQSGIGVVATNNVHYLSPEDEESCDLLLCIKGGQTVEDPTRRTRKGQDYSMRTAEQMSAAFAATLEAIENTLKIAERCTVELELNRLQFPKIDLPQNKTSDAALQEKTEAGLLQLIPTADTPIKDRLAYELKVINDKGYSGYFLVVADFVNWAKDQHISVTTRGSAAGSLVSYCIGITTVNPLDFKLPFERFLNPLRPSAPDIDIDIADDQRDSVIAYVTQKYGADHVAQICTFGTMLARAAVRDVGRALGYPYAFCDLIAKTIPFGTQGFHVTIDSSLEQNPDLKERYDKEPHVRRLIDLAKKIEGRARHCSVHAAGVVIAPEPLVNFVPLQRESKEEKIITQFEMYSCEAAGLVKMDFLGIRNLSILDLAVKIVEFTKEKRVDLSHIPLNDKKSYELLAAGNTMGLFQLGGSGMTKYLKELKPTNVYDIQAMVALYRPGPIESIPEFIKRKHNPKLITYPDARLEEYLKESYGLLVYQDDVLYTAITLAGYDWLEADKLRKAMGKKIKAVMAAEKNKFISGCIEHGKLTHEKAGELWALIEPFAAYGFNRAHSASYAMVAYQTAYMKANFPAEFMAAVMTCESHNLDKVAEAVAECGTMGIEVLPPDVNQSRKDFTYISDTQIRFGLRAIKNVGEEVIQIIFNDREEHGPFASLADFVRRVPAGALNRKAIESMVKAGAFDTLDERNRILENLERILRWGREQKKIAETGQESLFGAVKSDDLRLSENAPASLQEKLSWEKELLGFYLTAHPLSAFAEELKGIVTPIKTIHQGTRGETTLAGIVTRLRVLTTKRNERMCFAQVEDQTGTIEAVVFPESFERTKHVWTEDAILLIKGTVSERDDEAKILIDAAAPLEHGRVAELLQSPELAALPKRRWNGRMKQEESEKTYPPTAPITVTIPGDANPGMLAELKRVISLTPGGSPVFLLINGKKVRTSVQTSADPQTITRIERITGRGSVIP